MLYSKLIQRAMIIVFLYKPNIFDCQIQKTIRVKLKNLGNKHMICLGRDSTTTKMATGTAFLIMPPTLKKLEGHIAFGLSVCLSVRV